MNLQFIYFTHIIIDVVSNPVYFPVSISTTMPTSLNFSSTHTQSKSLPVPSLLKHTTSNSSLTESQHVGTVAKPYKSKRGRRPGRPPRSIQTNKDGVVSLGGVVKSPGGTDKKIKITIPSIEYPVSVHVEGHAYTCACKGACIYMYMYVYTCTCKGVCINMYM